MLRIPATPISTETYIPVYLLNLTPVRMRYLYLKKDITRSLVQRKVRNKQNNHGLRSRSRRNQHLLPQPPQ